MLLGSLRSYDGEAQDNVNKNKMNLCFIYESSDTLTSFTLFITVKTITKLNLGHEDQFEIEIYKISRRGSRSSDNAEFKPRLHEKFLNIFDSVDGSANICHQFKV